MTHLGTLLACDHYPGVRAEPDAIDGQLRHWLAQLGYDVDRVTVYKAHEGHLPRRASDADVWIVSGALLGWSPCGRDLKGMLCHFLRAAAAAGRPVLGLHHGEHLLHAALACPSDTPPETAPHVRAIRNPFRSFKTSDRLFRYDAAQLTVRPLERPEALTRRAMFPGFRRAA